MRIALITITGIHGIIHLFGFLKAFGISEFNAISQTVNKASGLAWLAAFILFIITNYLVFKVPILVVNWYHSGTAFPGTNNIILERCQIWNGYKFLHPYLTFIGLCGL